MSEYIDTILVECDRQSAAIKSDTDSSSWTNQQNNTIQLLPNDKVSVYSSYVNDIGSGQDNPIEFRGKRLNDTKQISFTINVPGGAVAGDGSYYDAVQKKSYTLYSENTLLSQTIELKDNKAETIINYYKTMDALNYIQLPRRFIFTTGELHTAGTLQDKTWNIIDQVTLGRTYVERGIIDNPVNAKEPLNYYGYVPDDTRGFRNYKPPVNPGDALIGDITHFILKNDNSRYTILERKLNVHPNQPGLDFTDARVEASYKATGYFAPYYARDPEYFDYHILRKKIDLEVDVGFSAAKNIADSLTQQLQKTEVKDRVDYDNKLVEAAKPQLDFALNKKVESQTYKTFESGSEELQKFTHYKRALFNGDADPLIAPTIGNVTAPVEGVHIVNVGGKYEVNDVTDAISAFYYSAYQYIACKRPEIYETGTQLNDIFGIPITNTMLVANKLTEGIIIDLPYFATTDGTPTGAKISPLQPSPQLLKFKEYLESQANYPELFSDESVRKMHLDNPYYDHVTGESYISATTSRFAHIDSFVNASDQPYSNCDIAFVDTQRFEDPTDITSGPKNEFWKLGQSFYDYRGSGKPPAAAPGDPETFNRTLTTESASQPFYFHYDLSQKDEFYEEPCSNTKYDSGKFTYGAFGRSEEGTQHSPLDNNHIIIYPNLLTFSQDTKQVVNNVGLPDFMYHTYADGSVKIVSGTKMGFDRHWNAWGTCMINLQSGKGTYGYGNTDVAAAVTSGTQPALAGSGNAYPVVPPIGNIFPNYGDTTFSADRLTAGDQVLTSMFNNKIYCGADKPEIGFNGTNFFLKRLHTPLNKGNLQQIKPTATTDTTQGATDVYKINPEQNTEMYSPVQYPYNPKQDYYLAGSTDVSTISRMNFNLEPLTIYDSSTGIFIEDFGYTKTSWKEGLWGRLGFSYEQFNNDSITRNETINLNNSKSLNVVTTNAKIECADTKSWSQNQFGVAKYNGELLVNYTIPVSDAAHGGAGHTTKLIRWIPPVNQAAESVEINAVNYPISMFNGYYNIRSDIVGNSSFIDGTGNTRMPIVSIVNKQNPVGDFYISPETDISFTITKPTRLSSVSVEITEPDGSPAPVSLRSSVIFKIERIRTLNTNLAREVFEKLQKEVMDKATT